MITGGIHFGSRFLRCLFALGVGCFVWLDVQAAKGETNSGGNLTKATAAVETGEYERALSLYDEVLVQEPRNVAALVGRANALNGEGRYDEAIKWLSEAIRFDPKNTAALGMRFSTYRRLHRDAEARKDADSLVEANPGNPDRYLDRGSVELDLKDYEVALDDVDVAMKKRGKPVKCLSLRARILLSVGSYAEAAEDISELHRLVPQDADFIYDRGRIWVQCARYDEAARDLEDAVRLTHGEAIILNDYAWFLATCADPKYHNGKRAVLLAEKATEISKGVDPGMLDTLAASYARTGNFEKAVEAETRAIDACKKDELAKELNDRREQYRRGEAYVEARADDEKVKWSLQRSECFDVVWRTVNDEYFDPTFGGIDWREVREKYRLKLWKAEDNRALRRMMQEMLDELHRTHFAIVPRDMAVLNPEERGKIGYTGAYAAVVDDSVMIVKVKPDSPAAKAGVACGDIVRSVDDHPLSEIDESMSESVHSPRKRLHYLLGMVEWWLWAPVEKEVRLKLESVDGQTRDVRIISIPFEGAWSEAMGFTPSEPLEFETVRGDNGVVCLRFNMFALPAMNEFKRCVRSLKPTDGLIIDLRGNPGGVTLMAPGMYGRLSAVETSLGTMHRRDEKEDFLAYPQKGAFLGPVAILVNGASASTSEILAAGMQETGRARIFGEPTAGAALPSLFRKLPTGDMFQYAIADIKTPHGVLIEGNGVNPDEKILPHRADCVQGRDPVYAAAEKWILESQKRPPREEAAK